MSKKTFLNILMVIATLLAILVLLPLGTATKDNGLGYNSLCSFAPFSSIILLIIAGFAFLVSKKSIDKE